LTASEKKEMAPSVMREGMAERLGRCWLEQREERKASMLAKSCAGKVKEVVL
jgi:hypothetical protein